MIIILVMARHGDKTDSDPPRTFGKSVVAAILAILSTIYLLNPGGGIVELIPDNIPIIGNLDEAAAAAILFASLSYFGLDLKKLFGRGEEKSSSGKSQEEKPVKGKVVDD